MMISKNKEVGDSNCRSVVVLWVVKSKGLGEVESGAHAYPKYSLYQNILITKIPSCSIAYNYE